jgi:hypothetical protein
LFLSLALAACGVDPAVDVETTVSSVANGAIENDANFPWVVRASGCHGVLISSRWVLTAAHCVGGPFPAVTYTRTNPTTGVTTTGTRASDNVIVHPDYDPGTAANDIALIRLTTAFAPDPLLQPAELPLSSGFVGQVGTLASKIDHLAPLPTGKAAVFRAPITSVGQSVLYTKSATAAACSGDSGSGYIMQGGGKHFVVGIASFVEGSGTCQPPTPVTVGLTNVFAYNSWIRSKTGLPAPATVNVKTDILWRNTSGALAIWFMNGATNTNTTYPSYYGNGQADNTWAVQGVGDFSSDSQTDILWRHPGGALAIWKMINGVMVGDFYPSYLSAGGAVSNDWQIAGIGDFNADLTSDILWRHTSGTTAIWLLRNGQFFGERSPGSRSTSWSIASVADFNGDAVSDILWRNTTGATEISFLNNQGGLASSGPIGAPGVDWKIEGAADFNGDRRADILWRHDDGTVAVWTMNGLAHVAEYPGKPGADWKIQKTGDFNGDKNADIVWRNNNGATAIWFMYGGLALGQGYPGTVGNDWSIKHVAHFDNAWY